MNNIKHTVYLILLFVISCDTGKVPGCPAYIYGFSIAVENKSARNLYVEFKHKIIGRNINIESGKTIKVTYSTAYELPENLDKDVVVTFYEPRTDTAMPLTDPSLLIKKIENAGSLFTIYNDPRIYRFATITDEMLE